MLFQLFLLLTVVPFVELMILLRIGAWAGWLPTCGLVIITGAVGAVLARRAGVKAIARINSELERGEMPTSAMADGVLILIAGVLLITPGVLTDLCGFGLLIAPVRGWVRRRLSAAWRNRIIMHDISFGNETGAGDVFVDVEGSSVDADAGGSCEPDVNVEPTPRLVIKRESDHGA